MSGVATWTSPKPGDSSPHVGLLDLLIWSFTGFLPDPGTLVSEETPSWPHLELVTLIVSARHPDLVTLVLTWASLVPGDNVPHLCLTWT